MSDDGNVVDDADLVDEADEVDDANLIDATDDGDDYEDEDANLVDAGSEGDANVEVAGTAKSVLEYLVRSVVDDPDSVAVEIDEGGRRTALNVTVGDGDMGRVIGKRGRVAQSIRTVTRAAAARDGLEIDIEFLD